MQKVLCVLLLLLVFCNLTAGSSNTVSLRCAPTSGTDPFYAASIAPIPPGIGLTCLYQDSSQLVGVGVTLPQILCEPVTPVYPQFWLATNTCTVMQAGACKIQSTKGMLNDNNNCGTCGFACSSGWKCCSNPTGHSCTNPLTDPQNCGSCGNVCAFGCTNGYCNKS